MYSAKRRAYTISEPRPSRQTSTTKRILEIGAIPCYRRPGGHLPGGRRSQGGGRLGGGGGVMQPCMTITRSRACCEWRAKSGAARGARALGGQGVVRIALLLRSCLWVGRPRGAAQAGRLAQSAMWPALAARSRRRPAATRPTPAGRGLAQPRRSRCWRMWPLSGGGPGGSVFAHGARTVQGERCASVADALRRRPS